MMHALLVLIHVIACFAIIGVVPLQPGNAAGLVAVGLAVAARLAEVGGATGDVGDARKVGRRRDGFVLGEAVVRDIQGLIPNVTSESASHPIGNVIYSRLVKRHESLGLVGD